MLRVDGRVSDPRQYLDRHQCQPGQDDEQRQRVHLGEPVAPCRESDPQAAHDDDDFDAEIVEQTQAARALVRPDRQRGEEREHEYQPRSATEHGRALLGALLRAPLLLALKFLHGRRRLGRKSIELPLDLFQLD
jgi:hypothetical protein